MNRQATRKDGGGPSVSHGPLPMKEQGEGGGRMKYLFEERGSGIGRRVLKIFEIEVPQPPPWAPGAVLLPHRVIGSTIPRFRLFAAPAPAAPEAQRPTAFRIARAGRLAPIMRIGIAAFSPPVPDFHHSLVIQLYLFIFIYLYIYQIPPWTRKARNMKPNRSFYM